MPDTKRPPGGFRQLTQEDRRVLRQRRQQELATGTGVLPQELSEAVEDKPKGPCNPNWSGRIHCALGGRCPLLDVFADRRYGEAFIDAYWHEQARPCGMSLHAMCRRKRGEV